MGSRSKTTITAKCIGCGATREIAQGEVAPDSMPECKECYSIVCERLVRQDEELEALRAAAPPTPPPADSPIGLNAKCPTHGNEHPGYLCPDREAANGPRTTTEFDTTPGPPAPAKPAPREPVLDPTNPLSPHKGYNAPSGPVADRCAYAEVPCVGEFIECDNPPVYCAEHSVERKSCDDCAGLSAPPAPRPATGCEIVHRGWTHQQVVDHDARDPYPVIKLAALCSRVTAALATARHNANDGRDHTTCVRQETHAYALKYAEKADAEGYARGAAERDERWQDVFTACGSPEEVRAKWESDLRDVGRSEYARGLQRAAEIAQARVSILDSVPNEARDDDTDGRQFEAEAIVVAIRAEAVRVGRGKEEQRR